MLDCPLVTDVIWARENVGRSSTSVPDILYDVPRVDEHQKKALQFPDVFLILLAYHVTDTINAETGIQMEKIR